MSESTKATIEILEHYHHNGGFYEIPVEVINTVEQELEEQDKETERLHSIIKEVREYIEEQLSQGGPREIRDLVDGYELLEILDKVGDEK